MALVEEVMTRSPPTVDPSKTLREAALLMASRQANFLLVVEDGRPLGIVTSMDMVVRGIARGLDVDRTPVRAVMSSPSYTASPTERLEEAAARMAKMRLRRLAVVDGEGHVVGVLTSDDIARWLAKTKGFQDALLNAICQYSEPPSEMPYM
ncbi:CBS domain-containing protein [Conexivisphaera calida]|uniref:CBS domain-containing protein n=1 Tax=Conexivisphaera calida TaxID=1874277 RepID=UPI00157ACD94|nr:CBS domain-containing protein [Conexivisphaera calida]